MENAVSVLERPSLKALESARGEILKAMADAHQDGLIRLFNGKTATLSDAQFNHINVKFERDKRIRELMNGMVKVADGKRSFVIPNYLGLAVPLNIEHYGSMKNEDWLRTEMYLLALNLGHNPDWKERMRDVEERNVDDEYQAFYILSYYHDNTLVRLPDDANVASLDFILSSSGQPLTPEQLRLLECRRNRDVAAIQRIDGMSKEEFIEASRYCPKEEHYSHCANLQGIDWFKTALLYKGQERRHEPDNEDIAAIFFKEHLAERFRAYYNFIYPHLVERAE